MRHGANLRARWRPPPFPPSRAGRAWLGLGLGLGLELGLGLGLGFESWPGLARSAVSRAAARAASTRAVTDISVSPPPAGTAPEARHGAQKSRCGAW